MIWQDKAMAVALCRPNSQSEGEGSIGPDKERGSHSNRNNACSNILENREKIRTNNLFYIIARFIVLHGAT